MTSQPNAAAAGQFRIGGDLAVNRLGFGAMRVTGKGIWGPPADPAAARATLKRVPELGVDFIDTADSYGPYVSEDLLARDAPSLQGAGDRHQGRVTRPVPISGVRWAGPNICANAC